MTKGIQMSKYHSRKTPCAYGHMHDSKAEAQRCDELNLLQKAGIITGLKNQPKYTLIPAKKYDNMPNERAVTYVADFAYEENGKIHVEDVKGVRTQEYIVKRKLFKALFCSENVIFEEVKR